MTSITGEKTGQQRNATHIVKRIRVRLRIILHEDPRDCVELEMRFGRTSFCHHEETGHEEGEYEEDGT